MNKVKLLYKYYPTATETNFSTKFVDNAKIEDSASWNISNSGLCRISITLNLIWRANESFQTLKSTENIKSKGPEMH